MQIIFDILYHVTFYFKIRTLEDFFYLHETWIIFMTDRYKAILEVGKGKLHLKLNTKMCAILKNNKI